MIPTSGLADYITGLAHQHGVQYKKTPDDAMADVITSLADDEVHMDNVALLLQRPELTKRHGLQPDRAPDMVGYVALPTTGSILALERAGIVPSEEVVPLHVNYLREKFNVRSIQ